MEDTKSAIGDTEHNLHPICEKSGNTFFGITLGVTIPITLLPCEKELDFHLPHTSRQKIAFKTMLIAQGLIPISRTLGKTVPGRSL